MDVNSILASNVLQNVSPSSGSSTASSSTTSDTPADLPALPSKDDFSAFLQSAFGKTQNDRISERELYAALVEEQLRTKDPALDDAFKTAESSVSASGGQIESRAKDVLARKALQSLVEQGRISSDFAQSINGRAFAAAQLDSYTDSLHCGGLTSDKATSRAVSLDQALFSVMNNIQGIESGAIEAGPRSIDVPINATSAASRSTSESGSNGSDSSTSGDGADSSSASGVTDSTSPGRKPRHATPTQPSTPSDGGGAVDGTEPGSTTPSVGKPADFSWTTDANGHAVITLPKSVSNTVTKVELHSELPAYDDTLIEEAQYSGKTASGQSQYTLSKSGSEYSRDAVVVGRRRHGAPVFYEVSTSASTTA